MHPILKLFSIYLKKKRKLFNQREQGGPTYQSKILEGPQNCGPGTIS